MKKTTTTDNLCHQTQKVLVFLLIRDQAKYDLDVSNLRINNGIQSEQSIQIELQRKEAYSTASPGLLPPVQQPPDEDHREESHYHSALPLLLHLEPNA